MIKRYSVDIRPEETEVTSYFVYKISFKKKKVQLFDAREREYYETDSVEGDKEYEWFSDLNEAQKYFDNIGLEVANFTKIKIGKQDKCKLMLFCKTVVNTKFSKTLIDEYSIPDNAFKVLKQNVVKLIHPPRKDGKDFTTYCC